MTTTADLLRDTQQQVSEQIGWIIWALGRLDLEPSQLAELAERGRLVELRAKDPDLRIAVVGETSSGKSSLLNAFLRRRLLPASSLVTTRATLEIRHRPGEIGEHLSLSADGQHISWGSVEFGNWFRRFFATVPVAIEQTLKLLLTASDEVAARISRMELHHQAPLLGGDVVLIDTPGFSVVDSGHQDQALAAAELADLLLVVTPAVSAASMTLLDFVRGPLARHTGTCVFVLTKLDLVPSEERDQVVASVRTRLSNCGLSQAPVLVCHPELALREMASGSGPALRELAVAEEWLRRTTAHRRGEVITETLVHLLADLLDKVRNEAVRCRAQLARAEGELDRLTLPSFGTFLSSWLRRAEQELWKRIWHAAQIYQAGPTQNALEGEVRMAISGGRIRAPEELAEQVKDLVADRLRADVVMVNDAVSGTVGGALDLAAVQLARDFSTQFAVLSELAGFIAPPEISLPKVRVGGVQNDFSGLEENMAGAAKGFAAAVKVRRGAGALGGAAAGSMVAPVLGTAVGAFVGWMASRPSDEALRQNLLERVGPFLVEGRHQVDAAVEDVCRRAYAQAQTVLVDLAAQYQEQWGSKIAELSRIETDQRAGLADRIAEIEGIARQAVHRQSSLR